MKKRLLSLLLFWAVCALPALAQTEIFNYKQAILGRTRTLSAGVNSINRITGEVIFGGGDSRGPTTPGLFFTWIWGDGTSNNGFFPQTKKYADVTKNYVAKVVSTYSATEKDTVEILVDFVLGSVTPVPLDPKLNVYIPNQPFSVDGIPRIPFPDRIFSAEARAQLVYLLHVGSTIEYDFMNSDVQLLNGKFEQYMFRDSLFPGAYALSASQPIAFGAGDVLTKGSVDYSSLCHEMAHNYTLNSPTTYALNGRLGDRPFAFYGEAIAQIFQQAAGYELINNYKKYGIDEALLQKLKANFMVNARGQRATFDEYVKDGMPFSSWSKVPGYSYTDSKEAFMTFIVVAYKFVETAEKQGKGYRLPMKRMMQFLQRFNADWVTRYDPQNDNAKASAFRATLWTAAMSQAFQRDMRTDFRAINFPVSDADYAYLNPLLLTVSTNALSLSATAGSAASVSVTTTAISWSVVSSQPWLTASIAKGSGSQSVTFTAAANSSVSSRTAVVALSATDFSDQVVTVVQAGAAVSSCSLTANLTATSLTLCQGNSATLTVSATSSQSASVYTWQRNSLELGNPSPTLSVSVSGTYSVTVTDLNNCSASSSVTIIASSAFTPLITGSTTFCSGQFLSLAASITAGSPPFSYTWQRDQTPITTTSGSLSVSLPGTYQVTATDTKGCVGTSTAFTLTQKPTPNAQIIGVGLLANNTVSLSAAVGPGWTHLWSLNGTALTGATAATYTVMQSGFYNVVVSNNGCTGSSPGFIVNLAPAMGSGREAVESAEKGMALTVSPNPSSGQIVIRLRLRDPALAMFRLTDLGGRTYWQWASETSQTNHQQQTDIRDLPPGLYLVVAEAAGQRLVRKVVKE